MSEEINKENILGYLKTWSNFDKEISEEGEAYRVKLSYGGKIVFITTPYEVGEFFLDFVVDDKPFYSDWYEIMDESLKDFMDYTEQVAKNFLFNEVRIKRQGWWLFKTHECQYSKGNGWVNVLSTKT